MKRREYLRDVLSPALVVLGLLAFAALSVWADSKMMNSSVGSRLPPHVVHSLIRGR